MISPRLFYVKPVYSVFSGKFAEIFIFYETFFIYAHKRLISIRNNNVQKKQSEQKRRRARLAKIQ